MRITSVTPVPVTFRTAREPMSFLFVRVETDSGLVGWGEACDSYGTTYAGVLAKIIDDAFAPLLMGEEVVSAPALATMLRLSTRRRLGDQWVAVQARSAIEIALWDLVGQEAGRPVTDLIGRVKDSVPIYASSAFLEEGPAQHHYDLAAPLLERGVTMMKVRTSPDWRKDLLTLEELRGLLPDHVELMIDGSETYTLPTALEIADRLHSLGIRWFEEPIPQVNRAAIAALCAKSRVPIAYGEHLYGREEAIDALSNTGISVFQPDASIMGGISECREAAGLAAFYGARVVPHVCAGPVSLAANVVLAATVPSIRALEYPITLIPVWDALGTGAPLGLDAIVDGALPVPTAPGLGVGLDEAVAAQHQYAPPGKRVAGTVGGLPDRFVGDR